jgi:hypothetical protein
VCDAQNVERRTGGGRADERFSCGDFGVHRRSPS